MSKREIRRKLWKATQCKYHNMAKENNSKLRKGFIGKVMNWLFNRKPITRSEWRRNWRASWTEFK